MPSVPNQRRYVLGLTLSRSSSGTSARDFHDFSSDINRVSFFKAFCLPEIPKNKFMMLVGSKSYNDLVCSLSSTSPLTKKSTAFSMSSTVLSLDILLFRPADRVKISLLVSHTLNGCHGGNTLSSYSRFVRSISDNRYICFVSSLLSIGVAEAKIVNRDFKQYFHKQSNTLLCLFLT